MIQKIILWIKRLFGLIEDEEKSEIKIYERKEFMSTYELLFYEKIKDLENEYKIVPQVNLATIVKKINRGYINELFKNIDFAIFDKDYKNVLYQDKVMQMITNHKLKKRNKVK